MIYVLYHQHNMILLLLAGRFRCTDGGGEAAGPGERAGEEGVPGGGADAHGAQPPQPRQPRRLLRAGGQAPAIVRVHALRQPREPSLWDTSSQLALCLVQFISAMQLICIGLCFW